MYTRWFILALTGSCLVLQAESPAKPLTPLPAADPAYFKTGILTLQDRIWAQTQIERVWYNHRIWPKENPGSKPPFEQMVPATVIEKKAADTLRMTAALKQFWSVEITPAMLQVELDRMERDSKDQATLHELFAALRDDPFLIAETVVRSNLTEKAIRHHFAYDISIHVDARRIMEEVATKIKVGADWSGLDAIYSRRQFLLNDRISIGNGGANTHLQDDVIRLSAEDMNALRSRLATDIHGAFHEEETGWRLVRKISDNANGLMTEALYIPKQSYDSWYVQISPNVAADTINAHAKWATYKLPIPFLTSAVGCDAWDAKPGSPAPDPRGYHSAIWTGTEMIVWGGSPDGGSSVLNTGGRYNPAIDNWIPTYTGNSTFPAGRYYHTAIWTGSMMIVWGGQIAPGVSSNTGDRYDPASDSWIPTSISTNVPGIRVFHIAIWSGSEMIIWGGINGALYLNTGGRYDPISDSWLPTSTGSNVPMARHAHTAVWTGSEMIIWGGSNGGTFLNSGGRYIPTSDTWTATPIGANVPNARYRHTAIWTGIEMIIWGGTDAVSPNFNTGGRYSPGTNTWTPTSTGTNVPTARREHTAIWNGSSMIIWGGGGSGLNDGARYSPASDSWTSISLGINVPTARRIHTAIWTGSEMIVWGGVGSLYLNSGGRYNPLTDSWIPTSAPINVPVVRYSHTAVWTGSEMIVWGGYNGSYLNSGGQYNPATDSWQPTSIGTYVPDNRQYHTAVWTGNEMIVWGGYNGIYLNNGGRYKPTNNTWLPTSIGTNVPDVRGYHTAVWSGNFMIIWGGANSPNLNTGGRYNPANDSWLPTSIGANVPIGRWSHTAVWTGNEMIVWGGLGGVALNSGGRYNPATDSWLSTSTGANVPTPREAHTAIWTGNEMIVWGGWKSTFLNGGGRYAPLTDSWLPTSTGTNTPVARAYHTSIWTGNEMIIWGGGNGTMLNSGGRFNPANGGWLPTSISLNTPLGRDYHTAIWTGNAMIVWGGFNGTVLDNGGIYASGTVASPGNLLRGAKSSGTIRFSWNSVYGAGSYNVKRCDSSVTICIPGSVISTPTIPQYGEADNPNSYFYAVEAVNPCGATP